MHDASKRDRKIIFLPYKSKRDKNFIKLEDKKE